MNKVDERNELNIFFTNDVHSHIPSSFPLFKKLASFRESPNTVLLDLGDFTEGAAFNILFHGEPELKIIKKLYDFIIPGNHGFQDVVALYKSGFPVLNCNLLYRDKLFFKRLLIHPYLDNDIAFVGIMSLEAFDSIEPEKRRGFTALDPYKVLPSLITKLRKENRKIILLSHSGFEYDMKIAEAIRGIDVILSSHCHSSYKKQTVNNTLIVKARENGKGVGRIEITHSHFKAKIISARKQVGSFQHSLKFLNKFIKKYRQSFSKALFNLPPGFVRRIRNRKQLTHYLVKHIQVKLSVDLALINYHCFRALLPAGKVTLEDMYNCCPLENDLTIIRIGKNQLKTKLEQLPDNVRKYICLSLKIESLPKDINLVTTSYLSSLVFADFQKKGYNTGIKMRDIVMEILLEKFGNKDDTYWIKNRRRSKKKKDHYRPL